MDTRWRSHPSSMDNPLMRPSAQSLQKPQVFLKVEFGVSWMGQHPPRQRGFEYKSRALRERNPDFPRHVPAPTTNYLAASSIQQFQQNQQLPQLHLQHAPQSQEHQSYMEQPGDRRRESLLPQHYSTIHLLPEPHEPARGRTHPIEAVPEPPPLGPFPAQQRTPSYGERHERGSSAPPPLSENHWDVVQQSAPGQSTGDPSSQHAVPDGRSTSNLWKDLPEVPTRFRLGEDGMPWEGNWTFPMGFEPYLEPDPYLRPESSHSSPKPSSSQNSQERSRTFPEQSGPSFTDIRSPVFQSPARGEDPAQRRNLEALGSAMMTVDNGFENQWWNQDERGERRQLAAIHPPPATNSQVEEQMALGWVGALLPSNAPGEIPSSRQQMSLGAGAGSDSILSPESSQSGGRSYNNMIVSPVSTFSGPVSNLSRSMSTRSDELYFCTRYA